LKLDYKIDETIIRILNDENTIAKYAPLPSYCHDGREQLQLHFDGILKALKKLGYQELSNRILSLHLKRLEYQKIIERSESKPGLARFCWLSKNTKLALQLELPIKVKSERGEFYLWPEKHTEVNKKSYLLLLSLAAIGVSTLQPVKDDLDPPLGAFYDNKQNKAFTMSTPIPDISASDFFHRYRDFQNSWRFHYIKFKDTSEVEWYFQRLMEFNPPILDHAEQIEWIKKYRFQKNLKWPPAEEGEEKRYGIADKKLQEFMQLSIGLLGYTEMIMRHIWRYERKPVVEEIEWYSYIYGKARSTSYFIEFNEERSRVQRIIGKTDTERKRAKSVADANYKACCEAGDFQSPKYKSVCEIQNHFAGIETIDRIRSLSYQWHQKLSSEEYIDVHSNYSIIVDTLMNIAYPEFMKDVFQPEK
jgi:hypothetical protein